MSISQILRALAARYSQCQTYKDCGTVRMRTARSESVIHFKTMFARPANLLFEWEDEQGGKKSTVACDGKVAYLRLGEQERLERRDLVSAVAGATGPSLSAAPNICSLLMPDKFVNFVSVLKLTNIRLVDKEFVRGSECSVVSGSSINSARTLWISMKDTSIIRQREQYPIADSDAGRKMAEASLHEQKMSQILQRDLLTSDATSNFGRVTVFEYEDVEFDTDLMHRFGPPE